MSDDNQELDANLLNQPEVSATETPEPAAESTEVADSSPADLVPTSDAPEGEAPAPYEPNFSYKVSQEEKQFPEYLKEAIKNKEVEEELRDIFSKAGGFEAHREKLQTAKEEYASLQEKWDGEYVPIQKDIELLKESVKIGDFDSFFKRLEIPKEHIYNWALKKATYDQLSPEQKATHDDTINTKRRVAELERENRSLTSNHEEALIQQASADLDRVLSQPEVNQVMQDFDRQLGKVGAFREEVICYARGKSSNGNELNAEQAVNGLLALRGASSQARTPATVPPPVVPASLPVIPNVQGRGTSPVGAKRPKSIEELKAYRKQKYGF